LPDYNFFSKKTARQRFFHKLIRLQKKNFATNHVSSQKIIGKLTNCTGFTEGNQNFK
jgi:hypothetical protein